MRHAIGLMIIAILLASAASTARADDLRAASVLGAPSASIGSPTRHTPLLQRVRALVEEERATPARYSPAVRLADVRCGASDYYCPDDAPTCFYCHGYKCTGGSIPPCE